MQSQQHSSTYASGGSELGQAMIGNIRIRNELDGYEFTCSDRHEVIEGFKVPTWIEVTTFGSADPDMFVRIELRDGMPQVVRLNWTSQTHQSEIKQKHLRSVEVESLVTEWVAAFTAAMSSESPEVRFDEHALRIATKFVERQRLPREYRVITDSFLKSVAEVYRRNIDHAPTQAVARTFGVRARMASKYVDRARRAGYLSRTSQGKKKA